MGKRVQSKLTEAALDPDIRELDLLPVRYALVLSQRWGLPRILRAEMEYRLFLQAVRRYPKGPQVPSRDADIVWHAHLLCSELYAEHCRTLFGRFLHHYPFAGSFGKRDAARQQRRFTRSQKRIADMRGA
jgi:hypothetical protein